MGTVRAMSRTIRVPLTLDQDEDGVWCASAELRPGVAAFGDGDTRQAALDDLRAGIIELIAAMRDAGEVITTIPASDEVALTIDVAA